MTESQLPPVDSTAVSDPGIPTLEWVLEPATLQGLLRRILPGRRGTIEDVRIHVLKHHPGSRCTLEICWRGTRGSTCVIGKVYAVDRHDLYRAMVDIRRTGFGPEHEMSIPLPLAYVAELRLLLQEKVRGSRVKEIFLTGDARDHTEAAERCGRWLARFHALAPRLGRTSSLDDHARYLEDWARSSASRGAPLADKARALGEQLVSTVRAMGADELCAGHGHYGLGHVVLAQGPAKAVDATGALGLIGYESVASDRTVAIDWDTHDVADPCRDVARFLVELKRLGFKYIGSIDTFGEAGSVFLATYESRFSRLNRERLSLFVATRCLHAARKDITHAGDGWSERAAAMLDEGFRVLERGL